MVETVNFTLPVSSEVYYCNLVIIFLWKMFQKNYYHYYYINSIVLWHLAIFINNQKARVKIIQTRELKFRIDNEDELRGGARHHRLRGDFSKSRPFYSLGALSNKSILHKCIGGCNKYAFINVGLRLLCVLYISVMRSCKFIMWNFTALSFSKSVTKLEMSSLKTFAMPSRRHDSSYY